MVDRTKKLVDSVTEKLRERRALLKKRRFTVGHFDLNYVTDNIIGMSFPSPRDEVLAYLDNVHPNHYKIFNLCGKSCS